MKTKTIPFNLETAKKIQAGEIKGKIKQLHGEEVEILCWDLENASENNLAVKHRYFDECRDDCGIHVDEYNAKGEYRDRSFGLAHNDLVLEVPDNEPQFKPFDKVLVRKDENDDGDPDTWVISYFMDESIAGYRVLNGEWFDQCIPYEGNEHLLGTTDKPKEE